MAQAQSLCLQDIYQYEKLASRFWKHVHKSDNLDGCWEWIGTRFPQGYGCLGIIDLRTGRKRWVRAHRIAYVITHGEIPSDLCACHTCDNVCCVRPDHLFLGTHRENAQDRVRKRRSKYGVVYFGEDAVKAKLTWEVVQQVRERVTLGESQRKIARELNVSKNAINDIVRHKTWLTEGDHYAREKGW